ncbi:hypothetical protein B0H17DRAFT_1217911 [Mycena rosella]|uniref:Uncharacterized protein n=1 Tax=Mycena rosella TaxID=1033263 RepID=A0AAD7BV93_MYCRO|nr:hypothetical protein B0H17DRAFT_1217911 [Mycena rosella]
MSTGEILAFLAIVGYVISYELVARDYRPHNSNADFPEYSTPSESPISMHDSSNWVPYIAVAITPGSSYLSPAAPSLASTLNHRPSNDSYFYAIAQPP